MQPNLSIIRAICDLRNGYSVVIHDENTSLLIAAIDTLSPDHYECWPKEGNQLLLTAKRFEAMTGTSTLHANIVLRLDPIDLPALQSLTCDYPVERLLLSFCNPEQPQHTSAIQAAAITLLKYAELLPTVIARNVTNTPDIFNDLTTVSLSDISNYPASLISSLKAVITAPLTLKGAKNGKIVAFRPIIGGSEHYAIIVNPDVQTELPYVRIHSSCYTGDLLRSLTCDCRDQLEDTINQMGQNNKMGIIVYLMQEGRGIGLTNKLRTYDLQAKGLDTVDANEVLGFEDDERNFALAAAILKQLNVMNIALLSNNPRKADGLRELGIHVAKTVSLNTSPQEHNQSYLSTKEKRLGHVYNS